MGSIPKDGQGYPKPNPNECRVYTLFDGGHFRWTGRNLVIRVRRAIPEDSNVLLDMLVENQSIDSSWESKPSTEQELANTLGCYFGNGRFIHIFEKDGSLVGACFHEHDSQLTINVHLHIHKDFRGMGLAHKLLLMDSALCKGLVIVSMVPESNKKLIKAMLKSNYVPLGYVPKCWNQDGKIMGRVILFKE